jgi:polyketide biosynthesis acyl carrier protein
MTKNDIFQIVKNNVVDVLPNVSQETIKIEQRLKDLGANSIDRMDIVTQTLEDLAIKIPMVELAKVQNIQELVDLLYEHAHK